MDRAGPVTLRLAGRSIEMGPLPILMGIVNVTPDSFSDGGQFLDPAVAVDHALRLIDEGADWIDIGGESTRPGAAPVDADTERARVLPVIESLARLTQKPISIDTSKPRVALDALAAGATILNDVTGFRDPQMVEVARASNAACIVMHMRGTPTDMMTMTDYDDVVAELTSYFRDRVELLTSAGVDRDRMVLDPGIGFAKMRADNLRILRRIGEFRVLGRPILLGASRKRIIGEIVERGEEGRLFGTIATSVLAYLKGVHILRVHDVGAVRDALVMTQAIEDAQ